MNANDRRLHSVTSINRYIKNMFANEYALSVVFVKGEISNCKYHSRGHIYFTLKDEGAAISCVMFAGDRRGLDFTMKDGDAVIVGGSISVYEKAGSYQLYAKKIQAVGVGGLHEKYEKLKKELEAKGYFNKDIKKPIPKYVKRVGIVTAQTGAAIQDIINISTRRNPYVQLVLYPAQVQGEGAALTVAKGIEVLDEKNLDVIIVGRGGGSIEDLWAFNEEATADAIFAAKTPIISAVGHETDFTIADFVADLRAPTPSAAAEIAVFEVDELLDKLYNVRSRLRKCMKDRTSLLYERLDNYRNRLERSHPKTKIDQKKQEMDDLEIRLTRTIKNIVKMKRYELNNKANKLDGLSPLKRLSSGYGYVAGSEGKHLESVEDVNVGDEIVVSLLDGDITSEVKSVKKGR